jgi:hypothetical protein
MSSRDKGDAGTIAGDRERMFGSMMVGLSSRKETVLRYGGFCALVSRLVDGVVGRGMDLDTLLESADLGGRAEVGSRGSLGCGGSTSSSEVNEDRLMSSGSSLNRSTILSRLCSFAWGTDL